MESLAYDCLTLLSKNLIIPPFCIMNDMKDFVIQKLFISKDKKEAIYKIANLFPKLFNARLHEKLFNLYEFDEIYNIINENFLNDCDDEQKEYLILRHNSMILPHEEEINVANIDKEDEYDSESDSDGVSYSK